jgi:3-oxoacyl-[acyl-carrier protein] reductase
MNQAISKQVLVTGATGGIGRPLSLHLAKKGYDLLLTARNQERLERLAEEIKKFSPVRVVTCPTDFGDPSTFDTLKQLASKGLHGLVVMPPQLEPTAECLPPDEVWTEMFRQSFIGPVSLIRELLPALKVQPRSKVVIISGISSAQILSHYATSNVLRTAWLAQAKTLAFVYGPQGIHFNTLSLGGVLTDEYLEELKAEATHRNISFDQVMQEQVHNVPLRKYSTPDEVAIVVEGLLSPFSDHITGVNLLCDGGYTRAY